MKRLIIAISFLLLNSIIAQEISVDTVWTKTFGGSDADIGFSVKQTDDGGYIITGSTRSYGNGDYDCWLIKTNSNGDSLWTKTFGGSDADFGFSVKQTDDGGYIITGYTQSYGNGDYDCWLIKTDSNGDSLWTKTYGGSEVDEGRSVQQTTDGGYIIVGTTNPNNDGQAWLIKTNSNGDSLWTKTFGGSDADEGFSVKQTDDGGYIITGSTRSYGNGNAADIWLIKTDSQGIEQCNQTFGGSGSDRGYSVQQTTDGGYIITGYTSSYGNGYMDFWLLKVVANHSPSSFALNEQDSVYITMDNFASDSIVFTWGESTDIDGDDLLYDFTGSLKVNGQVKAEYSSSSLTIREMKIDYQSVFDEIFAAQAMVGGIEWNVSVTDGVAEVTSGNGALTLGVNASAAVLSINGELLPEVFSLHQNYPNPFNPVTTLRYDLPENSLVTITIYDMLGRQVKILINQTQDAGYRSAIWDATNNYGKPVSAGIYLYQIQAGEYISTKKMVLLK